MNKLVLDPGLFEIPSDLPLEIQLMQFALLKENLNFALEHTNLSIDEYNGAPYSEYFEYPYPNRRPPVVKCNSSIRYKYATIRGQIHKLIKRNNNYIVLEDETLDFCPLAFYEETITELPFLKYLYYLLVTEREKGNRQIVLLSAKNYRYQPNIHCEHKGEKFAIDALQSMATNCDGLIGQYLLEEVSPDTMFPYKSSCKLLNDAFEKEKEENHLDNEEAISLFKRYGTETAWRNKYFHDATISRKNPGYTVFKNSDGTFYISVDIEHGALELFKSHGNSAIHVGEYNFSCILKKEAEPFTHKINI